MVIELANGGDGYIPPPEQHLLGGYNTWAARSAGLEVEAEPKIAEAAIQLLESVTEKPRTDRAQDRVQLPQKSSRWSRLLTGGSTNSRDLMLSMHHRTGSTRFMNRRCSSTSRDRDTKPLPMRIEPGGTLCRRSACCSRPPIWRV